MNKLLFMNLLDGKGKKNKGKKIKGANVEVDPFLNSELPDIDDDEGATEDFKKMNDKNAEIVIKQYLH